MAKDKDGKKKSKKEIATQDGTKWRTIMRTIFPDAKDADVIGLYMDTSGGFSGVGDGGANPADVAAAAAATAGTSDALASSLIDRLSVKVPVGERLSLGTYFNAFPASYWRKWTTVENIRLVVKTEGTGSVVVNRSNAKAAQQRVESASVEGEAITVVELDLKAFGDGGWYWFDLIAGKKGFKLISAEWQTEDNGKHGTFSLGMTTFNRADYCVNTAEVIANDKDLREKLVELIIVDQGTDKVSDQDKFPEVEESLGKQLKYINQKNVGGSGGFSRAMYESSENSEADYCVLIDDDLILEPESVLRQAVFADYARKPTIVGGHMFDLYNRSVLYTYGEVIGQYRFLPEMPNAGMQAYHDFNSGQLRKTPWLHRRYDVDYNGWWMCLIPTQIIREIGLSLPVFIKWDDMEYGLRAKEAGYPTVSLPGTAVWHVSWADKDDSLDWQSYYHSRNRLITALLHSDFKMGGRLIRESYYQDLKHLIAMQYFTQAGRNMSVEDLLQGPYVLHDELDTKLPEIRGMMKEYPDSTFSSDPDAFPEPKPKKPRKKPMGQPPVFGVKALPVMGKALAKSATSALTKGSDVRPEAALAHQDAQWYNIAKFNSVVVSNAGGTAASWYRRDPKLAKEMGAKASDLHAKLLKDWPKLRKEFRQALPEITSAKKWSQTFDRITEERKATTKDKKKTAKGK